MKSLQKKLKNFWENFYLVLVLIFLYAPIAVMIGAFLQQLEIPLPLGWIYPSVVQPDV